MNAPTLTSLALLCFVAGCEHAKDIEAEKTAVPPSPTVAKLTAGQVEVRNKTNTPGIPKQVTLEKAPPGASGGISAIRVKIPGTGYAIALKAGKVQPLIIREHPLEVWRIKGMRFTVADHDPKAKAASESITNTNRIEPADRQLKFILTGGEVYEVWALDFSNRKQGLQIRYSNDGGW